MGRTTPISRSVFSFLQIRKTPLSIQSSTQPPFLQKKGDAAMFGIAHQDAFRLLRKKRLLSVLQSDSLGVICKLTDAEGQPFHIKAKKIRRMLAGKQYRALCVSGENGDGNAFFVRSDELVALDPLDGRYVILSPLLEVLNTEHGDRVFSGNAN
jgi:predicted glutamine amidotransferase